jgi:hypothetical protein
VVAADEALTEHVDLAVAPRLVEQVRGRHHLVEVALVDLEQRLHRRARDEVVAGRGLR